MNQVYSYTDRVRNGDVKDDEWLRPDPLVRAVDNSRLVIGTIWTILGVIGILALFTPLGNMPL